MQFLILSIGKNKESYVEEGIALFKKRLKHYCNLQLRLLPGVKNAKKLSTIELKQKESEIYFKELKGGDYLVLLDENGKTFSSLEFSNRIQWMRNSSKKRIVFVIGGAYGFDDSLYKKADEKISLSKMTFSHQLIRVIFLEQLYRAFTIIVGEKYHNE